MQEKVGLVKAIANSSHPRDKWSLQTVAIICTKLEQGLPENQIRKSLDLENDGIFDSFAHYLEFALKNNWIIKENNTKYAITKYGKEVINALLRTD